MQSCPMLTFWRGSPDNTTRKSSSLVKSSPIFTVPCRRMTNSLLLIYGFFPISKEESPSKAITVSSKRKGYTGATNCWSCESVLSPQESAKMQSGFWRSRPGRQLQCGDWSTPATNAWRIWRNGIKTLKSLRNHLGIFKSPFCGKFPSHGQKYRCSTQWPGRNWKGALSFLSKFPAAAKFAYASPYSRRIEWPVCTFPRRRG